MAREWEELIQQEFFLQGDMEKELRLPVGPCNDRFTVDLAASQVYFYNAFGEPLFGSLCSFAPDLQHRLDTLRSVPFLSIHNLCPLLLTCTFLVFDSFSANCKIWAEEAKRNKLLKAAQTAAAQQQQKESETKQPPPTANSATGSSSAANNGASAASNSNSNPSGGNSGGSGSNNNNNPLTSPILNGGGGAGGGGSSSSGGERGSMGLTAAGGLTISGSAASSTLKMPLSAGRSSQSASRHASMAGGKDPGGRMLFDALSSKLNALPASASTAFGGGGASPAAASASGANSSEQLLAPRSGTREPGLSSPSSHHGSNNSTAASSPTSPNHSHSLTLTSPTDRDSRRKTGSGATKFNARRHAAAAAAALSGASSPPSLASEAAAADKKPSNDS